MSVVEGLELSIAETITTAAENWLAQFERALAAPDDGLAPSLRDKANVRLAFGAATWPHQLVRVMLLEQIYRAVSILSGHPYHRA